jgi:hypothetical protein
MLNKQCSRCGVVKPISDYYVRNARPSGHQSHCKECANAMHTAYMKTPKGRASEKRTRQTVGREAIRRYDQSEKGRAKRKRFMQTAAYKALHQKANLAYRNRYPEKIKAQSAIAGEIAAGRMQSAKTKLCASCGEQASHYHHYKGYEREHWFDVTPLCRRCHLKAHVPAQTG